MTAAAIFHSVTPAVHGADSEKAREFEREAIPELDSLFRYARGLVLDDHLAQDLVQETMLKAYRSWHRYRKGTNIGAWLLTILRNTFINSYRKAKQAPEVNLDRLEPFMLFDGAQNRNPETDFFEQIVDEDVLRAIDELPEEFRETLILRDLEGLNYEEIASVTEVAVGTVKSRLFRARRSLQERLYDYAVQMGYVTP